MSGFGTDPIYFISITNSLSPSGKVIVKGGIGFLVGGAVTKDDGNNPVESLTIWLKIASGSDSKYLKVTVGVPVYVYVCVPHPELAP